MAQWQSSAVSALSQIHSFERYRTSIRQLSSHSFLNDIVDRNTTARFIRSRFSNHSFQHISDRRRHPILVIAYHSPKNSRVIGSDVASFGVDHDIWAVGGEVASGTSGESALDDVTAYDQKHREDVGGVGTLSAELAGHDNQWSNLGRGCQAVNAPTKYNLELHIRMPRVRSRVVDWSWR